MLKKAQIQFFRRLVFVGLPGCYMLLPRLVCQEMGVPSILKSMMGNLKKYLIKGSVTISKSINLHTIESYISLELEKLQNEYIKKVYIGSYPFFRLGKVGVAVVLRSSSKIQLKLCEKKLNKIIKSKKIKLFKNN